MAILRAQTTADASRLDETGLDGVATKAVVRLFQAWKVNATAAARLCAMSERTWNRVKAGHWTGRLSQDQRMRMSALVGLYKGLHLYFSDDLADAWVGMPNQGPLFRGSTPITYMIENGLPGILAVREYVDAVRGGT